MSEPVQLPRVDMSAPLRTMARALDEACATVGFFVIEGHGLRDRDGRELLAAAKTVFEIEEEEKRRLDVNGDPNFRGYELAGQREAFEIGRQAPTDGRALCGPNRWPEGLAAEVRTTVERHYDRCLDICRRLVDGLIETRVLGGRWDAQANVDPIGHLRLWRYPEAQIELPAHADHGFFTLLLASSAGLEIRSAQGGISPAPSALGEQMIVNVGRLLAHVSGDRYRATVHRVRGNEGAQRFSAAFFHAPNDQMRVAPPAAGQAKLRSIGEYIEWGYTWQREVNAGAAVVDATGGQTNY